MPTTARTPLFTSTLVCAALATACAGRNVHAVSTAHPDWNPNGRSLLTATAVDGGLEKIEEIDLRGRVIARHTFSERRETYPAYAPDGTAFAFITQLSDDAGRPRFSISIHALDDNAAQVLVDVGSAYEPRFSPDGRRLVYTISRDDQQGIAVLDLTTAVETLAHVGPGVGLPSFAPDGGALIFNQRGADGYFDIVRLNLETRRIDTLVDMPGNAFNGHISPDGNRLVFMSDAGDPGNRMAREIYILDMPAGAIRRLTNNTVRDGYPKWSPSGDRIAIHSAVDDVFYVSIINVKTGAMRRLRRRE